jgi:hypothetical protein
VTVELTDNDLPVRDLRRRQVDCIGVEKQLFAIFLELERGPPLEFLEFFMFFWPSESQVRISACFDIAPRGVLERLQLAPAGEPRSLGLHHLRALLLQPL